MVRDFKDQHFSDCFFFLSACLVYFSQKVLYKFSFSTDEIEWFWKGWLFSGDRLRSPSFEDFLPMPRCQAIVGGLGPEVTRHSSLLWCLPELRLVKKLSRILVSWHLMFDFIEGSCDFWAMLDLQKKSNPNHQLSETSFFISETIGFFRMLIWCGTTPGNHGDPVLSAWMRDRRVCHKGTKRLNDYSTPQSSTMTIQSARNLVVFS